ncbi:MAG: aminotransferase class V-fold PLP-dependent enzyme [Bacteroidia bacterium]|nr:aminotransferase class V-fold PLP-dependent enzyme [Bacteroidia bacterium]
MKFPIYLDYNATTPVDPRVLEKMLPWFTEKFGNAASNTHPFGWAAEEAVKMARESLAQNIGADSPDEIVFTSGATEAINLALKGVAELYARKGNHLITVATEHKAVLDTCKYLEKTGHSVTYLPVDKRGLIDLEALRAAITDQTLLVAVMYANNETGVIHPLREIAEIVHEKGALFMSDATQAVGKLPVDVNADGIDLMTFSGHKMYGPKGVGGLYLRKRRPRAVVAPQIHGGGHEHGFRSGTLNVPGIVGMSEALQLCQDGMAVESQRLEGLRDQLQAGILEIPGTRVNGLGANRLPNTLNVSFEQVEGEALIMALKQLAVSTGSACTSAIMEPSHVLSAMGVADDEAIASVRFSLGRFNTGAEIEHAIDHVKAAVKRLRGN